MQDPLEQEGLAPKGKQNRAAEMIQHAIADYLSRESNRTSLITVTSIDLAPDMSKATVYVTVLPETATKGALDFINRKRDDARAYLKQNKKLRRIPFITFALDEGEKNRQRIDDLLNED